MVLLPFAIHETRNNLTSRMREKSSNGQWFSLRMTQLGFSTRCQESVRDLVAQGDESVAWFLSHVRLVSDSQRSFKPFTDGVTYFCRWAMWSVESEPTAYLRSALQALEVIHHLPDPLQRAIVSYTASDVHVALTVSNDPSFLVPPLYQTQYVLDAFHRTLQPPTCVRIDRLDGDGQLRQCVLYVDVSCDKWTKYSSDGVSDFAARVETSDIRQQLMAYLPWDWFSSEDRLRRALRCVQETLDSFAFPHDLF